MVPLEPSMHYTANSYHYSSISYYEIAKYRISKGYCSIVIY